MKQKIVFSIALSSILLVGCGGGGSDGGSTKTKQGILISKIFPQAPKIPLSASVKLMPVVIDKYTSSIKTPSLEEEITVTFSSANTNIATVDENGIVTGKILGSTTITALAKKVDGNVTYEDKLQIPIKVVNTFGDIDSISLNPTRATIDRVGGKKTFDISAINNRYEPASLSQGTLEFNISNPQNNADKVIKQPKTISDGSNSVVIESAGDRDGYVFITPVYTDKYDKNVTATGNPLVVQVNSIAKATPDNSEKSAINAGKYLDLKVYEVNGAKELHIVHYDEIGKNLKYSFFNGSWKNENIKSAMTGANSGKGAKIVLSPFENNYRKPIVVALEDNDIYLWYQNNSNNWVNSTKVSQNSVIDNTLSLTYSSGEQFLDSLIDETNKFIYVTYFSAVEQKIYIKRSLISNSKDFDFSTDIITPIDVSNRVQSLSMTLNSDNKVRLAYSTYKDSNKADNLNGVFYASIDDSTNTAQVEKLAGTTGDERGVVLRLDKSNRPAIIYYTTENRLFYNERTKEPAGYVWSSSDIKSGSKDSFKAISGLDFVFDYYNSPRIIFNSDDKIKYARRLPIKNNEWVVETPEGSSGKYGEYKAIELDSENRIHMVYTSSDDKWFKYWAEPIFFEYRKYDQISPIANIDKVIK